MTLTDLPPRLFFEPNFGNQLSRNYLLIQTALTGIQVTFLTTIFMRPICSKDEVTIVVLWHFSLISAHHLQSKINPPHHLSPALRINAFEFVAENAMTANNQLNYLIT